MMLLLLLRKLYYASLKCAHTFIKFYEYWSIFIIVSLWHWAWDAWLKCCWSATGRTETGLHRCMRRWLTQEQDIVAA